MRCRLPAASIFLRMRDPPSGLASRSQYKGPRTPEKRYRPAGASSVEDSDRSDPSEPEAFPSPALVSEEELGSNGQVVTLYHLWEVT